MEKNNETLDNLQLEKDQFLDEMTAKYIYGGGPTLGPIGPIGPIICFSTCLILCGIVCMPACYFAPGAGPINIPGQF